MSKWFVTACVQRVCLVSLLISGGVFATDCLASENPAHSLNGQLRHRQDALGLKPLRPMPLPDTELVTLGRMLFFDPILSGNKDTACATCHHPLFASADGRQLAVGTGGTDLGPDRRLGPNRSLTARHSTDLFERARPDWKVFFWDGRLQKNEQGQWQAQTTSAQPLALPAIGQLMGGLALQALLPPLARIEMRGQVHHTAAGLRNDRAIDGTLNELAASGDTDLSGVWQALQRRVLRIPGYQKAFARAFPVAENSSWEERFDDEATSGSRNANSATALFMQQTGLALQAFMQAAFRADDTPWDRFLADDDTALSNAQKRGALLFYGEAKCGKCHSGPLLTDQGFHNIGVIPYAASLLPGSQQDLGRFMLTRRYADRYAFRTPPLRNVALTAPYFHNGSAATLEEAIKQHLRPLRQMKQFNWDRLPWELRQIVQSDDIRPEKVLATRYPIFQQGIALSDDDIGDLVAFLQGLTDSRAQTLHQWQLEAVPSGLLPPGKKTGISRPSGSSTSNKKAR